MALCFALRLSELVEVPLVICENLSADVDLHAVAWGADAINCWWPIGMMKGNVIPFYDKNRLLKLRVAEVHRLC